MKISKKQLKRKRMCWDKQYYPSKYSAEQNIIRLRAESPKYDHPYRIYACPHCLGYHLTHLVDPTYRDLENGEEIALKDIIYTGTNRLKVDRINEVHAFAGIYRYPRKYNKNGKYKVIREVKHDN